MKDRISPAHGSGGKIMNEMINSLIRETLGPDSIQLDDSAVLDISSEKIAFTTDTFVITPLEFSGGDIGSLAVNGTVNDLAVMGAEPKYMSCALILEEDLELKLLKKILTSMKNAADYAGIKIVTGDTKVVPKGKGDKIFINTTGVGLLKNQVLRKPIAAGDKIIISGSIGDHGISIMAGRNNHSFPKGLSSACAPMNHITAKIAEDYPEEIKFMRDPTRGGVASVLNEIVQDKDLGAKLFHDSLPVKQEVTGVCEILGIDPLYAANEGKILLIVKPEKAEEIVADMKQIKEGAEAAIIGEITESYGGKAYVETEIGGKRILPLLIEEQLPRIC